MPQETPRSLSDVTDLLAVAHVRPEKCKDQSKSNTKTNDHLSGLFRVGRVVTSIFDRGRHLKYDYRVVSSQYHTRDDKTPKTISPYPSTSTVKSSRASSMATLSQAGSSTLSASSSRRGSSESSTEAKRSRRGGMSVS